MRFRQMSGFLTQNLMNSVKMCRPLYEKCPNFRCKIMSGFLAFDCITWMSRNENRASCRGKWNDHWFHLYCWRSLCVSSVLSRPDYPVAQSLLESRTHRSVGIDSPESARPPPTRKLSIESQCPAVHIWHWASLFQEFYFLRSIFVRYVIQSRWCLKATECLEASKG